MHKHKSKGVKDLKDSWSGSVMEAGLAWASLHTVDATPMSLRCHEQGGGSHSTVAEMRGPTCPPSVLTALVLCSFQPPRNKQSQSSDNMFCLEPRDVRWKSRMCPCSYCSFLSLIFFAWGLTERCLQDSDLEFCCWGDRMRRCDLCLGTPEVAGWTAPNPRQSRQWAGGLQLEKVLFPLSLSLLISHFLFFWLISLSWNSLQFPPMTSPNISHHTVTWTTETLTSFTLCSSGWQPV